MHRYQWLVVRLGAVVAVCVVTGLLSSAAASRQSVSSSPTTTKRCHYVVKKVRGKKKRVRVCGAPSADVRVAVRTEAVAGPGLTLIYNLFVRNLGPGRASDVRVAVTFPRAYMTLEK